MHDKFASNQSQKSLKSNFKKECKLAVTDCPDEKFELNKQNVRILQRIVDARQVNVRNRMSLISSIQAEEKRANSQRGAMLRADARKMSSIALSNQKLAVKLFTSKPTY